MIQPKEISPLDGYEVYGIKSVGLYDYYLLVATKGECVICQAAQDDSSYLYAKMPVTGSSSFSDIADAITDFWVSPELHSYQYLFQL